MEQKIIINHRLATVMVTTILLPSQISSQMIIKTAQTDAWFSYILPLAYGFLLAYLLYLLCAKYPDQHIFQITRLALGNTAGAVMNVLIIAVLWMIIARDIQMLSLFLKDTLLPDTPQGIIMLVIVAVVMYYISKHFSVSVWVNQIFFPIFMLTIIFLPLLVANESSFTRIMPVLTEHPAKSWAASVLNIGLYGDLIVLAAFLHLVKSAKHFYSALRCGVAVVTMLLTVILLSVLMVFGPYISARMVYPNYSLIQMIHITDFLDRLEIFLISMYYPVMTIKIIMVVTAMLIGLSSFQKHDNYRKFSSSVSLFILLTSYYAFRNIIEVFKFMYYSQMAVAIFVMLPLLILLAVKGKRKTAREITYRRWFWIGNLFLAASFLSVITGQIFGSDFAIAGTICGIAYGACLMLTMVSTYIELRSMMERS